MPQPPDPVSSHDPHSADALTRLLEARVDLERARTVDYSAAEFNLRRMRELLGRIGNPHRRLAVIHVAGTKGKGSTAAMLAAILSAAGHRTGLYTSPHLNRVEERMAIDGQPCSPRELNQLAAQVEPAVAATDQALHASGADGLGLTYFEVLTAMAMLWFVQRQVDLAVLEVGLGGRLDATNVCHPRLSVITSISLDHTQQLGNTLASIAAEKAGIIKPGVPVVSCVTDQEPREVIRQIAWRQGCRLSELGVDFDFHYRPPRGPEAGAGLASMDFRWLRGKGDSGYWRGQTGTGPLSPPQVYEDLPLRLWGRHQAANAATALAALREIEAAGWSVPEAAVRTGLAQVVWPARVEQLGRRPLVIVDGAHNVASIEALLRTLDESFPARRRRLIFAASHDKDCAGMLQRVVPRFDQVLLTRYQTNPRAVPPEELAAAAGAGRDLGEDGRCQVFATPAEAWAEARRRSGPEDLICVAGSLFLAAELRHLILNSTSTHSSNPKADQA